MTSSAAPFPVNTRFFTISTAGHVDHGKTSLIRALTWIDPDRLKEEKERQMTTDLGFAHLKLGEDFIVGFVDVPGHGKFLKNMLAGVGGIDLALLVVAADEGPMPQTRQHVRILSLLGVTRAVVAMTKIDMVEDTDQRALVEEESREMLKQHSIECVAWVPVSATKNVGINELKQTLKNALEKMGARDTTGGAFLPVDRVFSKAGFGTVITGTVVRGKLAVGDQFVVGPDITSGRVRRLETFGHPVNEAVPGQRVACNVVLKDNKDLTRGNVILGRELPSTKMMLATLVDKPQLAGEKLVEKLEGQPIRLYHGTAECHGYIRWAQLSAQEPGVAIALLALDDPTVALAQDKFVIRLSDETIFGGEVLLRDKPRWMRRAELIAFAEQALANDFGSAAMNFISSTPQKIARMNQIELFMPSPRDAELIRKLAEEGKVVRLGENVLEKNTRADLSQKLQQVVGKAEESMPLEVVRTTLSPKLDRNTFLALVDEEAAAGKLMRKGDQLALPSAAAPKPTDAAAAQLQEKISAVLDKNLCLEITEIAKECAADQNKVKAALNAMSKEGKVHIVAHEFAISDANLKKCHKTLADIWQVKRNIAPTDFRESMNTSRKYAMALLQHFDDHKITRRLQEGRVLLKAPS
jgi:selenocysteine-specific elongation factor